MKNNHFEENGAEHILGVQAVEQAEVSDGAHDASDAAEHEDGHDEHDGEQQVRHDPDVQCDVARPQDLGVLALVQLQEAHGAERAHQPAGRDHQVGDNAVGYMFGAVFHCFFFAFSFLFCFLLIFFFRIFCGFIEQTIQM